MKLLLCAACLAACSNPSPAIATHSVPDPAVTLSPLPPTSATGYITGLVPTPSLTPTLLPTPDMVATAQAGSPAQLVSAHGSPDGFWWARVFSHPCPQDNTEEAYGYDTLQITDLRSGEDRIMTTQLINCGGLGAYGLEGRFWAHTSRFYYYTNAAHGVPDGCGYWLPPLLRIDVTDWSITYLGPAVISPDGFKLAAWREDELVVWDINGKQIGSSPPPVDNTLPGPIAWAPDGKAISFLLSEQYCPLGLTYVIRMNLADFQPALFFASQDPSFADIRWDLPNRVILTDESGENWAYNFITGDLARYRSP